jgi:hypothetical protein
MRRALVAFGWLALLSGLGSAAQRAAYAPIQVRTLEPDKDNTLYEDPLGGLSNGKGHSLFAGLTAQGSKRRALVSFDVASVVPTGSRVVSAALTMHVTRTIAGPQDVGLHLAFSDWGEGSSNASAEEGDGAPATAGDATWLHTFHPASYWSVPGGDFAAGPSATRTVGFFGPFQWSSPQLAADVQAWVDAPATNFGWVVLGPEPSGGSITSKRFGSSDNVPALRPTLTIVFDSIPKGACCFGGGCARITAEECALLGGTYQGNGTHCVPDPCPP